MILFDVNVLVYAATAQSRDHERWRDLVAATLQRADPPVAISELILSAVVRIITHPRIFTPPASPESAFAFVDALRAHPRVVAIAPGRQHWRIFQDLVLSCALRGGDVSDAWFAALAIEHGCDWWSTDRGFARFPGLRWRDLHATTP